MNCYQKVTEINKKGTPEDLFKIDYTVDSVICPQPSNQFKALLIAGDKSSP